MKVKPFLEKKIIHKNLTKVIFYVFCCLLIVGCKSLGPNSIKSNRGAYMEALSQTDKEEMLANIIRSKYNDPPVFLKIKTISANPTLEFGTEDSSLNLKDAGYSTISPKLVYRESPSIIYSPLMGTEYSKQLLMPMGIINLFLMLNNGFDLEVIADLMIININGKTNSRNASEASREDFKKIVHSLNNLYKKRLINLSTSKESSSENDPKILIDISKEAFDTEEYKHLIQELDLKPKTETFEMKIGYNNTQNVFAINTRSFLALINYLSNYVEVPQEHQERVWKSNISAESGYLHIYNSKTPPSNANTAVYLYNNWFYIKNEDISSQNVLYLIQILFDIQAHTGNSDGNIQFTLPIR